ncbi:hypothetical protein, partial [Thiolapillus sp.]|uniref:hypothetical protein n=2 Tax=Thiolapillus sp. TaxID=2017437 RepID=UPI003AF485CC
PTLGSRNWILMTSGKSPLFCRQRPVSSAIAVWRISVLSTSQACLRPRDRFWDIPVPKIDSAFDNLFVPQPSWSPSTTQQLRKLVAAPYLSPNDWTPRSEAYFASPLALCARRVSSAASRLLGSTSLRFALHGWQRA